MNYVKEMERDQLLLLPACIDEYIDEENPVRLIDAFVDGLDLVELGFKHAIPNTTGRPPYPPAVLMKLIAYGYFNRIRSSRALERECGRNLEVIWLTGMLRPDFKTICNFRKDNGQAIKGVLRSFNLFLRDQELFGGETVGIDSSKFKACNSKKRNFNSKKLRALIRRIDSQVDEYLRILEEADGEEPEGDRLTREEVVHKIEELKVRRGEYQRLCEQLAQSGEIQVSLTDPDSRAMCAGRKAEVGYSVQMTVDAKHKLILDHEVTTQQSDQGQLSEMAVRAKEFLGKEKGESLEVVADRGYHDRPDLKKCVDADIVPIVPEKEVKLPQDQKGYPRSDFRYDPEGDVYLCPQGSELAFIKLKKTEKKTYRVYEGADCQACPFLKQCSPKGRTKTISRWEHEEVAEQVALMVKRHPEKVELRKQLCEHPFGTIKRGMNQGYFLTRGLKRVSTEMSLTVLAYNMKRAISIIGVAGLVAALKPRTYPPPSDGNWGLFHIFVKSSPQYALHLC